MQCLYTQNDAESFKNDAWTVSFSIDLTDLLFLLTEKLKYWYQMTDSYLSFIYKNQT